MAEIKWIKLSVNMFNDEKIKLIKTMPEGDKIIVIWVQLLCLAGKTNDGGLVYMGQNMAYTDEMFATLFDEKLNVIRIALQTLEQFGMIELTDDGKIDIVNWEKHQSTDKMARMKQQNRIRQQKHYYRTKLREIGVDVDSLDLPDDPEELKEILDKLEEKTNVRLTLANGTEVRSKKEEVRSKKKEVNSSRDSAGAKYDDDSPYMKLAVRLYEHIKKRNPKQKEPNWQKWADDMRKTVELDNREINELTKVLDWCQQDDFWQNNILSPAKLRKQYDQLFLKMDQSTPKERDWDEWEF